MLVSDAVYYNMIFWRAKSRPFFFFFYFCVNSKMTFLLFLCY